MVGITLAMIVLIVSLKVALVIEQRRTRNTKEV